MISAILLKELEKKGFNLDFPSLSSNEDKIIEILKEKNERLYSALPLLMIEDFDYEKIKSSLKSSKIKKDFNHMILITNKIFEKENMENEHIKEKIKKNNIRGKIGKSALIYHHDLFKNFMNSRQEIGQEHLKKHISIRKKLSINKALKSIFAPAKIRILEKIFNHEPLTNTELKYYYKSISPINKSILNEELRAYLQIIESAKKTKENLG